MARGIIPNDNGDWRGKELGNLHYQAAKTDEVAAEEMPFDRSWLGKEIQNMRNEAACILKWNKVFGGCKR